MIDALLPALMFVLGGVSALIGVGLGFFAGRPRRVGFDVERDRR